MLDLPVIVAGTAVAAAWLAYRRHKALTFGVDGLGTVQFERFPASAATYSRMVAVTGGCGFVGRRIVQQLLETDPKLRVVVVDVVVPPGDKRDPRVEYVRSSITSVDNLVDAFRGADSVIHTASIIPTIKMQESSILEMVNVEGTAAVINACKKLNIKRLIYTSSATVVLDTVNMMIEGADETWPYPSEHLDRYTITKHQAEDLVQAASQSGAITTAILRPACVFGSGDKFVTDYYVSDKAHYVIGTGNYHLDWVHADDVASAHVLAEKALREKPDIINGQIYNIGASFGKNDRPVMTHGEFVGLGDPSTKDHWGLPRPICLPILLIQILALLNELLWKSLGCVFDDILCRTTLVYTQRTYYFDSTKARKHFGYEVKVPLSKGIAMIVESYQNGTHPFSKVKRS